MSASFTLRIHSAPSRWLASGLLLLTTLSGHAQPAPICFVRTDYEVGDRPYSVAVGDVNADGRLDIVAGNYSTSTVSVLLGQAGGSFGTRTDYAVGDTPRSVIVTDLNADGRADIVTANFYANSVSVLLGLAGGGFAARADYEVGTNPYSVAVGDINADGRADIVAVNLLSNSVSILLGKAGGGFGTRTDYPVGFRPSSVAVADLNADGRADIVVCNGNSVSVLLGQASGGVGSRTDYAVSGGSSSVAVADVNADGRADIITAAGGSVSVLPGQAGGGFGSGTDYVVGDGINSVAVGDLNADGRADIITANFSSNSVSVLLGLAGGGFEPRTDYQVSTDPYSVAVGDFNADGRAEIVLGNNGAGSITVLAQLSPPTLLVSSPINCTAPSVRLTAQGGPDGVQYNFAGPALSGISSTTAAASQPGEYTLTVSSKEGCSARSRAQVELNTSPPQNVSLTSNGPLSANRSPVTLTAASSTTAGVSVNYSYSQGARVINANQATVSTSGVFSVTATRSDNGCTATATTTVLGANSPSACRGASATITLSPAGSPVRYEWYIGVAVGQPLRDGSYYQGTATASLRVVSVTQSQIYYAKVFYADGSSVVYGPYRVTLNTNCGAREAAMVEPGTELRITLLGNPLQGEALRALVSGAAGQRLLIELVDLGGRPVGSQVFEQAESSQLLEWNLSGKASGVYLLQALSDQQRRSVKVLKP